MATWTAPFRWLYAWLDRAVCAALALLLAQAPMFTQQYQAQLAQAQARTQPVYDRTTQVARQLNLNVEAYLAQQQEAATPAARDSLALVASTLQRHQRYAEASQQLAQRPAWLRPLWLLTHMDGNVRKATTFQPGVPQSFAGLLYAIVGLTLGWLLMSLPRFRRRR